MSSLPIRPINCNPIGRNPTSRIASVSPSPIKALSVSPFPTIRLVFKLKALSFSPPPFPSNSNPLSDSRNPKARNLHQWRPQRPRAPAAEEVGRGRRPSPSPSRPVSSSPLAVSPVTSRKAVTPREPAAGLRSTSPPSSNTSPLRYFPRFRIEIVQKSKLFNFFFQF